MMLMYKVTTNAEPQCVYASCDDIPNGCIYGDGFGPFNEEFTADLCSQYGGTPCEEEVVGVVGCMDSNATNYDADATVQGYDQYTYSVFMLHVMIFQNTDVFMEMVLVHLMKNLVLIYVHNMVELRVRNTFQLFTQL